MLVSQLSDLVLPSWVPSTLTIRNLDSQQPLEARFATINCTSLSQGTWLQALETTLSTWSPSEFSDCLESSGDNQIRGTLEDQAEKQAAREEPWRAGSRNGSRDSAAGTDGCTSFCSFSNGCLTAETESSVGPWLCWGSVGMAWAP